MGPTFFHPYPRRLESQTVCRCHYKGSSSSQLFKDPVLKCWSSRGLNPQLSAKQTGILPTELARLRYKIYSGIESTLKVSSRMEDPSLYECCVGDRFGEAVESKREHKHASH